MEPQPQILYLEVAAGVLGALWVLSEALAQIPSVKENSVFQVVASVLRKLAGK
jgi:hypothetical protein